MMPDVHIVDDDEAIRESLAFLLQSVGHETEVYCTAMSFLASDWRAAKGCLITDVRMPGLSGLDLTVALRAKGFDLPILMITGHADIPLAVQAMKAGVSDFLEKPFTEERLLSAIRTATRSMPLASIAAPFHTLVTGLSPREVEVLRGVISGKANKVIAGELGISPRTVEVYRANVMSKTGAASLAQLVRMAISADFN